MGLYSQRYWTTFTCDEWVEFDCHQWTIFLVEGRVAKRGGQGPSGAEKKRREEESVLLVLPNII